MISAFQAKTRWYEGWTVLDLFSYLHVPLGYITWEHLGMSLAGLWYLNLTYHLAWWWEKLLYLRFKIQLTFFWLGTWKFFLHMLRIFCWCFTWQTGWLDGWHCRRIFGWVVTGNSTWTPTWTSKYWSWYTFHAARCASWVVVWLWSVQVSVFLPPPYEFSRSYLLGGRYFFRTSL